MIYYITNQLKNRDGPSKGHPYYFLRFLSGGSPLPYSVCGIRITHGLAPQSADTEPVHCFNAMCIID